MTKNITPNITEIFNNSYERCTKDDQFFDRFYQIFLASNEEVKKKFRLTDMEKQKGMLKNSLIFLLASYLDSSQLNKIARSHSKQQYNIEPKLYVFWLDSMIESVRVTDSHFSEDIESAWRAVMQKGIDYMIRNYEN
jgi:hemoglobin-like flavoprotein